MPFGASASVLERGQERANEDLQGGLVRHLLDQKDQVNEDLLAFFKA